jgi:hypothetical protein
MRTGMQTGDENITKMSFIAVKFSALDRLDFILQKCLLDCYHNQGNPLESHNNNCVTQKRAVFWDAAQYNMVDTGQRDPTFQPSLPPPTSVSYHQTRQRNFPEQSF